MHLPRDWSGAEDLSEAGISDHEELHVEFCKEDDEEPPVGPDAVEHVEHWFILSPEHSAIEHVEKIHHHEGLEHEGVVL